MTAIIYIRLYILQIIRIYFGDSYQTKLQRKSLTCYELGRQELGSATTLHGYLNYSLSSMNQYSFLFFENKSIYKARQYCQDIYEFA